MTNETTASQPKSIGDDAQFRKMLMDARGDYFDERDFPKFISYIDSFFRAPAAQASATIQAAPDKFHWCPECGSEESEPTGYDNGKYCSDCGQEWFPDLDYTDVVRKHLAEWKKSSSAATIQEPVMVAEPVGTVSEAFKAAFLKWNGFHTEAEIAAEWAAHGGLCGTFFREGLAAAPMVADPAGVAGCVHSWREEEGNFGDTITRCSKCGNHRPLAATVKAVPIEALELALCESAHLFLKPDQPYIFRVKPDCPECKALAQSAAPQANKTGGGE